MSNLKPDAAKTSLVSISPDNVVCFEDYVKSDKMDIYELLSLSSLRDKESLEDKKRYLEKFTELCASNITNVTDDPIVFSWTIDGQSFLSTSFMFELYLTTLSLAEQAFASANNYKTSVHLLMQCKEMLKQWDTVDLIYPNPSYKCTKPYVEQLLALARASMLLAKPNRSGNALSTALNFAGSVSFHIPNFSDVALNHYLLARTLLYRHLVQTDQLEQGETANTAYTAAKEALACCRLIDRSKCHIDTQLDTDLNEILEELPEFLQNMEQVYYSVDVPLESIRLPNSVSLTA